MAQKGGDDYFRRKARPQYEEFSTPPWSANSAHKWESLSGIHVLMKETPQSSLLPSPCEDTVKIQQSDPGTGPLPVPDHDGTLIFQSPKL